MSNFLRFSNVEAWHEGWLAEYWRLAADYCKTQSLDATVHALLFVACDDGFPEDEICAYEVIGSFDVPVALPKLAMEYAKFALSDPFPPDEVRNSPVDVTSFPFGTAFLLSSLLEASFPRNTRTNIFRGHVAGTLVSVESDYRSQVELVGQERADACVFAGMGVMLMNQCRRIVAPEIPDAEIIERAENIFIHFRDPANG